MLATSSVNLERASNPQNPTSQLTTALDVGEQECSLRERKKKTWEL